MRIRILKYNLNFTGSQWRELLDQEGIQRITVQHSQWPLFHCSVMLLKRLIMLLRNKIRETENQQDSPLRKRDHKNANVCFFT